MRFTIVIDFIVNVYTFPLAVELVLVPVALLLVGMQVIAENDVQYAPARRVIEALLVAIGLGLFVYFAIKATTDLAGFLTREHAEAFLLVPALTLAFVPFLVGVSWVSQREQENLRRRFWTGRGLPA